MFSCIKAEFCNLRKFRCFCFRLVSDNECLMGIAGITIYLLSLIGLKVKFFDSVC